MAGAEQWKNHLEQWKNQLEPWKNQLEQWLNQGIKYIQQIPPTQLYAAIAVLLFTTLLLLLSIMLTFLITWLYFYVQYAHPRIWCVFFISNVCVFLPDVSLCVAVRVFKRTKSNTIVLTGLSGSGKTVLFYQLRDGSSHEGTVTSMEPNEGTFVLHSETTKKGKIKPVHLVDVPGHSRLRLKLDEFLPQAAGIVFVVDALEFLPNCRAASEYLYDVLTKASVVKKKIPVLILCNKTDKVTAHTKEFIRKQMEKEIDKLRASRSAISEADIANDFTLGVPGEVFSFSQCSNKVTVAEASGLTGDISQVETFLSENENME